MKDEASRGLTNPFGIDTRALAALRIALGSILFADLAARLTRIAADYSGDAAHPIERARAYLTMPFSLHLVDETAWYQGTLLGVAALAAALLTAGFKTRWMTILSWYLLVSLHHRSYHIQDVGDQLLRLLLLWSIFLPMGRHYSIDARRSSRAPELIRSFGSVGMVLQVVVLYLSGFFHKLQGETWTTGEALETVLQDDVWVQPLGALLLEIPSLPKALTFFTLAAELLGPLLLLSPFAARRCRLVAVFFLTLFTLGIGTSLQLGVIPWVAGSALLPFLPTATWDRLDRKVGAPSEAAEPLRGSRAGKLITNIIAAVFLVQMLVSTVDSFLKPSKLPLEVRQAISALGLDQAWGMYAPDPVVSSYRVQVRLDLESGETVELVLGSPRLGWPDGETLEPLEGFWNAYRGRMLIDNIIYPELFADLRPFLVWACDQWNAAHPDRPTRSAGISKQLRDVRPAEYVPGRHYRLSGQQPLLGHICSEHR